MVYKTLKKVSDYCQLLDKSKFPATRTTNGITFTNNGDGTITVNGTSTAGAAYQLVMRLISCKDNHKYLVKGSPSGGGYGSYRITTTVSKDGKYITGFSDSGSGNISNALLGSYKISVLIDIYKGTTVSNLVFKPQLFDLTEMYRVGNEPTTVDEFKADFPNDLYDYKPYCFVKSYKTLLKATDNKIITSYKKSLVCKTKNLFDINSAVKVSGFSSFSKNVNQITVSMNDGNRYRSANVLLDTSLAGKTVTFRAYAKTSDKNTACLRIQWLTSRGSSSSAYIESNNVSGQAYQTVRLTGIIPAQPDDEHSTLCLSFYSNGYNTTTTLPSQLYTVVYTDIQLELGDTATEYHPYGYL